MIRRYKFNYFLKNYLDNNFDTKEDLIIKIFTIYKKFKNKFKKPKARLTKIEKQR